MMTTAASALAVLGMLLSVSACGQLQRLKTTSHSSQPQQAAKKIVADGMATVAPYRQHVQQTAVPLKVKTSKANALKGQSMDKNTANHIESVSAVSISADAVRASVVSHGCTSAADFLVEHVVEQGMCRLTITRHKPDLCKRAPLVVDIEIKWSLPDNCADLPVVLANPLLLSSTSETLIKRIK